jgi:hypothetical protein
MLFEHYHLKVTRKRGKLHRSLLMDLSLGSVSLRVPSKIYITNVPWKDYENSFKRVVAGPLWPAKVSGTSTNDKSNRPSPDERIAAKRCAVCSPLDRHDFPSLLK